MKKTANNVYWLAQEQQLRRSATYRVTPQLAYELEIQSAARRMICDGPNSKNAIVNAALELWFQKNPLKRKQRDAIEVFVAPKRGAK